MAGSPIFSRPDHARFTNEAEQCIQTGDDGAKHERNTAKDHSEFTHA